MSQSPALILHPESDWPQWIVRPLRNEGKPIPRFVWHAGEREAPIGYLCIDWEVSDIHRRGMKLAKFTLPGATGFALPPLRDVAVVRLAVNDLTITGFEQIGDREFAQTWYCRLARVGWVGRGKPDEGVGHIRD